MGLDFMDAVRVVLFYFVSPMVRHKFLFGHTMSYLFHLLPCHAVICENIAWEIQWLIVYFSRETRNAQYRAGLKVFSTAYKKKWLLDFIVVHSAVILDQGSETWNAQRHFYQINEKKKIITESHKTFLISKVRRTIAAQWFHKGNGLFKKKIYIYTHTDDENDNDIYIYI